MADNSKAFDANAYVKKNSYPLTLTNHSNLGLKLRCIDDRATGEESSAYPIAIPGAGLGILMDAMGSCTLLRRSGKHVSFEPTELISLVERAIGPITFHTDEKSVKNKGVPCGGCGHCNGALMDPVKYLLSESDAKFFVESGLSEIKESLKAHGEKPIVYSGSHLAVAVITILGTDLGLSSVSSTGEHVYVYHKEFHELLLTLIAHEFAALVTKHSQGVSVQEFETALKESAQIRLSVTLEKLARDLPKFVASKKPSLVIEPA